MNISAAQNNVIPNAIKRWNWGAFLLNSVWALRHGIWFGLWMFIPGVNLIVPFVLGIKGNEWAWKKNNYNSVDDFLKTQRKWAIGGLIFYMTFCMIFVLIMGTIVYKVNNSETIQHVIYIMNNNNRIAEYLGAPIKKSGMGGTVKVGYSNGIAYSTARFNVQGVKMEAQIDAKLRTKNDKTVLTYLSLIDTDNKKIVFIKSSMESPFELDNVDTFNDGS